MRLTAVFSYIRGEASKTSHVKRDVGNVTKESEVTFEYGIRSTRHPPAGSDFEISPIKKVESSPPGATGGQSDASSSDRDKSKEPNELPFQVQICYTDLDGARAMRVLTQTKPVTTEREQAETCLYF